MRPSWQTRGSKLAKDWPKAYSDLLGPAHHIQGGRSVASWLPTGLPGLELAMGTEGLPSGRLVLVLGYEGVGKSTLCLHMAAQCCAQGGNVVWADNEQSWYESRAEACGVISGEVSVGRPLTVDATAEWFCKCAEATVKKRKWPCLFVWDNTSAKGSEARLKARKDGKSTMQPGDTAKALWRGMRDLMGLVWEKQIYFLAIGQLTDRIGMGRGRAGETYLGEKALGTSSSMTLRMYHSKRPESMGKGHGQRARVSVTKNRFAPPNSTAYLDVLYGPNEEGRCLEDDGPLFDLAVAAKIVTGGKGGVYEFDGSKFKRSQWPEFRDSVIQKMKEGE